MAVYFITKNRFFTKAVNVRPIPNKLPTKWITIRRSKSTKLSGNGYDGNQSPGAVSFGQSTSSKKGKLSQLKKFHSKWSWKAGAGFTILSILDWWLLAAGGWFTWSSLLMKWTPLGICFYAAIEWHLHNLELERKGLPKTASALQTNIYCSLPLRMFSRCWGWLADCNVPTNLRPFVYGTYSNMFNVNLDEAANPDLKDYRSLAEFFTRPLKDGVRIIDDFCLVSPADGKVLHFGLATNSQIEQVKGVTYSLESFLGPNNWIDKFNSNSYIENIKSNKSEDFALFQCVIYLAPGDYHRFHSPTSWEPQIRRHFSGELLSVSPKIAQWLPGLFCLNERALYMGKWQHGFFSFTAVGATNVGSVQIYLDEKLKTNKWMGLKWGTLKANVLDELNLPEGTKLTKGELLGQFNMGSTVVLVFEAPKDFQFSIKSGQQIKVGERLGCLNNDVKSLKTKKIENE